MQEIRCPKCGEMLFKKKGRANTVYCHNAACKYSVEIDNISEITIPEE